ncbi:MAG: hypothetical protein IJN10_09420, partial [Firmicutes bacterium]|nr:hypothetical protein [Bacillota bacterium]
MKFNISKRRYITLLLLFSLFSTVLCGCRRQIVERIGVLPDRPTQFVAHNTETEVETQEGKSWDVQNADELRLYATEMEVSEVPSSHYYNNTAYLHRIVKQDPSKTVHSFERLSPDGTLTALHSMAISETSNCSYSPSGAIAAYSTWIDGCLTLMLVDLKSNEQSILWQSDEASLLTELGLSACLQCHWSADGSTLLFMPICFTDPEVEVLTPGVIENTTSETTTANVE